MKFTDEKNAVTDGPTEIPSYRDAWTPLKERHSRKFHWRRCKTRNVGLLFWKRLQSNLQAEIQVDSELERDGTKQMSFVPSWLLAMAPLQWLFHVHSGAYIKGRPGRPWTPLV